MKNIVFVCSVILSTGILIFSNSCQKLKNIKTAKLTTANITEITQNSATSGGTITDDGGSTVTEKGVCWNIGTLPTIKNNKTSDGTGYGTFTSEITGLSDSTTYIVRAYATNEAGTSYGNPVTFTATKFIIPCTPAKNSIIFNSQPESYYVFAGINGLVYGDYGLVGNGMSSDLRIEFSKPPITGKYLTVSASTFTIGDKECIADGTFGGTFSYHYVANGGDTVYVIKNGTDKYSMSFCNLKFGSASTSFTFQSRGNLTSE